jgi:hypothetical protein
VVTLGLTVWAVGVRRTLIGLVALLLAIGGPWLIHRARDPMARPPAVMLDVDVSPTARLVAVEPALGTAAPGETVSLTLLWQATGYNPRDLQSGIRLVPAGGDQIVAERWARPDHERTPTGKWIVGELVPDAVSLRIPPNARPGRYRLLAGLRDADAPNRTPASLVPIGEIEVR